MKVAVWDTWVTRKDGSLMHFDIIAPEEIKDASVIHEYGKAYLKTKGEDGQHLTSKECRFCHVETVKPESENKIRSQGYYILEMENCGS
jgi:sorbitol-specific phosphotransferase system component IIA